MATYGKGQMLGSGVDARMFVQDYSGFAEAAKIRAQGMAQLGADIGGAIKDFGDYKKQQAEQEKRVKSAELVAKAISQSFPSLAPMAQEAMFILGDKNNSLNDRVAAADAVENALKIGVSNAYKEREFGLQEREVALREQASRATDPLTYKKTERTVTVNGKPYSAELLLGSDGNLYDPQDPYKSPIYDVDAWASGEPQPDGDNLQPVPDELKTEADLVGAAVNTPIPPPQGFDVEPTINNPLDAENATPLPADAGVQIDNALLQGQQPAQTAAPQIRAGLRPLDVGKTTQATTSLSKEDVQKINKEGGTISGVIRPDGGVDNARVTYAREGQPSTMTQKEEVMRRAKEAYDAGNDVDAVILMNAAGGKGLMGMYEASDLPDMFGERKPKPKEEELSVPSKPLSNIILGQ